MDIIKKKKFISFIPPDSGPGNQIISIKECLIISFLLDRTLIIPPIREHYLKNNKLFYNFNDIFNLKIKNIKIDDTKLSIIKSFNIQNVYTIHSKYFNKKLRHENLFKNKFNEKLLNCRIIKNKDNLKELINIDDDLIIIKHLFNNVKISICNYNGCFKCPINNNFKKLYINICKNFDFSNYIKKIGDKYIINNINKDFNFVSLHIRLPDLLGNKSISELTNNIYNKNKINNLINNIKKKHNCIVYILSNNITFLSNFNNNFLYFKNVNLKYYSFIDQYISCKSKIFYYLNLENTRFFSNHNRSTYTSFIIDYRKYLLKKKDKTNINLRINSI